MLTTYQFNHARHSGMDCRNPVAMEGQPGSHPCVLDTGNPCRYDRLFCSIRHN